MSLLSGICRHGLLSRTSGSGVTLRTSRRWSSIARTHDGERLTIDALGASFPFVWLRDSCLSHECIHPSTSQKLHRSSDISGDIRPADVKLSDDGLHIDWADGHKSFFPRNFLHRHSSSARLAEFHADLPERPWGTAEICGNPNLYVSYESLRDRSGLRIAIDQLCTDGLLFVVRPLPTVESPPH
ncbi:hypothetical protein C8R43DRAFT_1036290 [Mycena crocata]|nr:hypothetical protein C8R43DRAFT_1036290 [Mycena crocata]